MLDKNAGIS